MRQVFSTPRPLHASQHDEDPHLPRDEPLFLPGSQLSQADQDLIREAGLGIENMNMDEFNAMMDDEGEEVVYNGAGIDTDGVMDVHDQSERGMSDEIEDTQMAPTQDSSSSSIRVSLHT